MTLTIFQHGKILIVDYKNLHSIPMHSRIDTSIKIALAYLKWCENNK